MKVLQEEEQRKLDNKTLLLEALGNGLPELLLLVPDILGISVTVFLSYLASESDSGIKDIHVVLSGLLTAGAISTQIGLVLLKKKLKKDIKKLRAWLARNNRLWKKVRIWENV